MCGTQRLISGVILICSPPMNWARVFTLSPELTDLASLASQLALWMPRFYFPSAGITVGLPHPPDIYAGAVDPNSGLHTYVTKLFTH